MQMRQASLRLHSPFGPAKPELVGDHVLASIHMGLLGCFLLWFQLQDLEGPLRLFAVDAGQQQEVQHQRGGLQLHSQVRPGAQAWAT